MQKVPTKSSATCHKFKLKVLSLVQFQYCVIRSTSMDVPLCGAQSFTIQVGARDEIVPISRLKPCTDADATPGSPRHHGWPPSIITVAKLAIACPGGPSVPMWALFSHPLVSTPSYQEQASETLGTVFSQPHGFRGVCTPQANCFFPVSTAAVPAVPVETASKN